MMLALPETELMPWLQKACVGVGVATSRLSSHGHCHSPGGSVSHPLLCVQFCRRVLECSSSHY
jgi:hypothetical protein